MLGSPMLDLVYEARTVMWEWIFTGTIILGAVACVVYMIEMFLMTRYSAQVRHWLLAKEGPKPRYPLLFSDFLRRDLWRWRADRAK